MYLFDEVSRGVFLLEKALEEKFWLVDIWEAVITELAIASTGLLEGCCHLLTLDGTTTDKDDIDGTEKFNNALACICGTCCTC